MPEDKYTIRDLLDNAVAKKPYEFDRIFGELITNKLSGAIANKKIEVAKQLYNKTDDSTEEE